VISFHQWCLDNVGGDQNGDNEIVGTMGIVA